MEFLVSALVSALAFRLRGHNLRLSTTVNRVGWALIMSALAVGLADDPRMWALTPVFFLSAVPGWIGSISLEKWDDWAGLTLRGVLWTAPAALTMWALGYDSAILFAPVGLACAPLYWLGHKVPVGIRGFLWPGPEWGEALFGAALGVGLAGAII